VGRHECFDHSWVREFHGFFSVSVGHANTLRIVIEGTNITQTDIGSTQNFSMK